MINVTKPFLPPYEEYEAYLKGIWERNWLTNHGPLVNELESKLREFLGVPYLYFVSNGTIALQIAIKALGKKGEIITTPFSYVATTTSIIWEDCTPVFVDINPEDFTMDPALIERAVTDKTIAILPTHVYGIPCRVDEIQRIAEKYDLKVIYDGAHAFGTSLRGRSALAYGDISTLSFHATKLFHTIEGGAVITSDEHIAKEIGYLRNFGHNGPNDFVCPGINGKNSEFNAAMGLSNFKHIGDILQQRKRLWQYYAVKLLGSGLVMLHPSEDIEYNHAYFPVVFPGEAMLLTAMQKLEASGINARRYFYPSLENLPYLKGQSRMPVSSQTAARVLCLPLYHDLSFEEIDRIVHVLLND